MWVSPTDLVGKWPHSIPTGGAKWLNRAESSQIWSFNEAPHEKVGNTLHGHLSGILLLDTLYCRKVIVGGWYTYTQGLPESGRPGNLVGMLVASDVGGLILPGMPSRALRLYAGGSA